MNREISTQDLQLLSAYLDGQLPAKERTRIETRLQSQPELREELESLRRTRLMLGQLTKRRAPRNFFITAEMVPKRPSLRLFPVFRLASALASLLLVTVFAGDLLFGFTPRSAAPSAAPVALQSKAGNSASSSESLPPVFTWGTPTPAIGTGRGGGGSADAVLGVGGKGGGPVTSDTLPPALPTENASAPASTGTPMPGLAVAPTAGPAEAGTPPSMLAAAPVTGAPPAAAVQDQYQSGPVLGVNPTQGAVDATQAADLSRAESLPIELPRPTMHIVEVALALLAVLAGLAAFLFHRRES
jgi:hypothetical protein